MSGIFAPTAFHCKHRYLHVMCDYSETHIEYHRCDFLIPSISCSIFSPSLSLTVSLSLSLSRSPRLSLSISLSLCLALSLSCSMSLFHTPHCLFSERHFTSLFVFFLVCFCFDFLCSPSLPVCSNVAVHIKHGVHSLSPSLCQILSLSLYFPVSLFILFQFPTPFFLLCVRVCVFVCLGV